eukprot:213452-Chlamydomonas_euryale.AAC.2
MDAWHAVYHILDGFTLLGKHVPACAPVHGWAFAMPAPPHKACDWQAGSKERGVWVDVWAANYCFRKSHCKEKGEKKVWVGV